MMKAASEINKNCPIMVDSITRFDNSAALTNNTFHFNYTILDTEKIDYDTSLLKETIKTTTVNSLKTDPKYKLFRDNHKTLSFTYHEENGVYLCNVLVKPNEYEK